MKLKPQTQTEVDSGEKVLRLIWIIVAGAVIFSVLNVTPLVERYTNDDWDYIAWVLPLVVDIAIIIVVRVEEVLGRLGGHVKGWPVVVRWLTGLASLGLNVGDSAIDRSPAGVAVHAVAPALLIATTEAAGRWRRAINAAIEKIEEKAAAERARNEQQREERERRDREERERAREGRERREREEGERRERLERERLDREQAEQNAAREHALNLERERLAVEEREREAERNERQRRWEAEQAREREAEQVKRQEAEAERRAKEARERELKASREHAARPVHEQPKAPARERSKALVHKPRERAAKPAVNTRKKLSEAEALELVNIGVATGATVRDLVDETGWSTGWVSQRMNEIREQDQPAPEPVSA